MPGRLSVSRTFGDVEAKMVEFGGNAGCVVATPDIKSFKINSYAHDFIVLACDGIYDKLSSEETIECVWKAVKECKAPNEHQ